MGRLDLEKGGKGMKDATSDSPSRLAQVAKELHKLADGIGSGKVKISGVDLTLSDFVTLKVKQKMTGSKVVFDLKIQAKLVATDIRSTGRVAGKKKSGKGGDRPDGVKALKKKYTGLWRVVAAAIKKGDRPDVTTVRELQAVSSKYGEAASPEWLRMWHEHEALVNACVGAVQDGNFIKAEDLLGKIGRGKKSCHKIYK